MKKIDFDYLSNYCFSYVYMGDGWGQWNHYLKFKRNREYSIESIEYELSSLPLIDECEILVDGLTSNAINLSVIWNGKGMWTGDFQLKYLPFSMYDTDFAKYLENRINGMN